MNLDQIILDRIPPAMLERVVHDQGVLDGDTRSALFKPSGLPAAEIATRTVAAYGDGAPRLAYGLYRQVHETDWGTAGLLYAHFQRQPEVAYHNHQASLVGRIPWLQMKGLTGFLESVERHVCLIVSRNGGANVLRGTGFLVASNMVLTCRHVVKSFPATPELPPGGRIELYFDFFYGDPVEDLGPNLPEARKVGLHANWLVDSGEDVDPDGVTGDLTPEQRERITSSLDFALLRLDQPIGLQPLNRGGGRRRGWIKLPKDDDPRGLQPQDWIIIPQHPYGFPQRIDLGRFREADQTGTRIRYSTNTAKGTSGAPCFSHNFTLVGLHNAYVGPAEEPIANQAIRFDHIACKVRPHTNAAENERARHWSVSRDREDPRAILGRDVLLEWLALSANPRPTRLAHRVYAAQALAEGAGSSFSIDILEAEIRDSKTPRAIYGKRGQQLAATAEDFLHSLLRELGIDPAKTEKMPARPSVESLGGATEPLNGEVDKLERWLANELPGWLGRVITTHVEHKIDVRPLAQQAVAALEQQGEPVSEDLRTRANAADPVWFRPNAWELAYVVIDDLRIPGYAGTGARTELPSEVQALVAGVIKGMPEESMDAGLRRLRWMFLGCLPDILAPAGPSSDGATTEVLDPAKVGAAEIVDLMVRMSQTHLPMNDVPAFMMRASASTLVELADAALAPPMPRLARLQGQANILSKNLLRELPG